MTTKPRFSSFNRSAPRLSPAKRLAAERRRQRNGFAAWQIDHALDKVTVGRPPALRCPCCDRSLGRDWTAHHRDGDVRNCRSGNLVLACADCIRRCYHDPQGVARVPHFSGCQVLRGFGGSVDP